MVDTRERLKRDAVVCAFGEAAAEIVPIAAHGERGGADRSAKVEGEDLGLWIEPELQRHERQQHRFAGAGRYDDQRVADRQSTRLNPITKAHLDRRILLEKTKASKT